MYEQYYPFDPECAPLEPPDDSGAALTEGFEMLGENYEDML